MTFNPQVKPERCHTCGTASAPQIFRINNGDEIVTEAHYICANPHCRTRFRVTKVAVDKIEQLPQP